MHGRPPFLYPSSRQNQRNLYKEKLLSQTTKQSGAGKNTIGVPQKLINEALQEGNSYSKHHLNRGMANKTQSLTLRSSKPIISDHGK